MSTIAVAPLSTSEAESLISAATRAAETAGVPVSVAVLDAGGQLIAFRRDDQARLISGETSRVKAYTSLQLNAPTLDLAGAVQRRPSISPARCSRAVRCTPCPPRWTGRCSSSAADCPCIATAS